MILRTIPLPAEKSRGFHPTSQDVRRHILDLQRRHPRLVRVRTVLASNEGRPIDAVTVTDPTASASDQQHVLIVAGQHGNEESARLAALSVLDWLVSPAARPTIRQQKIVVMPNVNPDSAERDIYATPDGIKPNLDHALSGPTTPEGKAVETVAYELEPEVFVDMHARGHAGCSYDMVLYPPTKHYTLDDNLFHEIAADMARAGEASGIPHVTHPLTWPGWGTDDINQPSTTCFAYRTFKSIVMLTENSESNAFSYPEHQRAQSGAERIKALLAWGNRQHRFQYYKGYPNGLVTGLQSTGIAAVGKTAAARRRSRVEIWRNVDAFRFAAAIPEHPDVKRVTLEYTGPDLGAGAGIQIRSAGKRKVKTIFLNARRCRPSETCGYVTWHDHCSTYVVIAQKQLVAGKYEALVEFA